MKSFGSALFERLREKPAATAFTFLTDRGQLTQWTNAELMTRALGIARTVERLSRIGDRVALMLQPGLDYVASFLACVVSGRIAVPLYTQRRNRSNDKIVGVLRSCSPSLALVEQRDVPSVDVARELGEAKVVAVSDISSEAAGTYEALERLLAGQQPEDIVFLQYTSGSTGRPKGVMVSHANLIHNSTQMAAKFRTSKASCMVSWLPPFHDMGLILGILHPLFVGFPCHLMMATAFVQRPYTWLKRVSDTRATISGGPNFAYELCVRRITEDELAQLDLSSWETAFNGAEHIRLETLKSFISKFAKAGFPEYSTHPCYGLAENTLMTTGQSARHTAIDSLVTVHDEETGRIPVISVGSSIDGQTIKIVNPATATQCDEGVVGEIWITGPSVAKGYWNDPEATSRTFEARIGDRAELYLRTGDLGFFASGALHIRGRLKEVIVVRGVKYFPEDLEVAIEQAHPGIRKGGFVAAFPSRDLSDDSIGVAVEVSRTLRNEDRESIHRAIVAVVSREFGLQVGSVAIFAPGRFPKTSSGKIPRRYIRSLVLSTSADMDERAQSAASLLA